MTQPSTTELIEDHFEEFLEALDSLPHKLQQEFAALQEVDNLLSVSYDSLLDRVLKDEAVEQEQLLTACEKHCQDKKDLLQRLRKQIDQKLELFEDKIISKDKFFHDVSRDLKRRPDKEKGEWQPVYCSCQKGDYGEMICCANLKCPRPLFHISCVGLSTSKVASWRCPFCRTDEKSNHIHFY